MYQLSANSDGCHGGVDLPTAFAVCASGESNFRPGIMSNVHYCRIVTVPTLCVRAAGARLCTSAEMANDETRGTGCG